MIARLRLHLVALTTLLCLPAMAAGELQAVVEPRITDELDTVRLTIRHTGGSQSQRLDLEALEEDFEVLTTQSASQYRSMNGRVQSWVEYQILLRPRRSGTLTIPPVEIGGETTETLTLQVRGLDPELKAAIDRMVFFESELSVDPVYVQAQTVLIRRLFYSSSAQIYSDLPGLPEIPNAVVTPVGETASSTAIRDGRRYGVIEQRFAIFPEQSGALTIPPISVTSSVRLESNGRTRRSGVRIATEPLTVNVLPIPAAYPANRPWLPAESVTLVDQWTPPDARIDVGAPIRRSLTARVEGNVSSVVPPLEPALPDEHFRLYPEPPTLEDDITGYTLQGTRRQSYAIIPTAPGTVRLPPTEVVWWDVNEERIRTARAPARTLTLVGAPIGTPEADSEAAATVTAPQAESAAAEDVDVRRDQVPWPGPERRQILWLSLAAMIVVTPLLAWLMRRFTRSGSLGAHPPSKRHRWRELKRACGTGDADSMHEALTRYLRVHYDSSAADAVARFRADGHDDVVDRLNAARYGRAAGNVIGGAEVVAAVRALRRQRPAREPLPALYD